MGKAEIYLYIGRTVIAIYILIVFILVLAETIERSNIGTTEPSNYKETVQVMEYVTTNLAATPLQTFTVLEANATNTNPGVLSEWTVDSDWCWCRDAQTNKSTTFPYLGVCTDEDLQSKTLNCTQWPATTIDIEIWKGASLQVTTLGSWSYPVSSNYTCESSFDVYQESVGLCLTKGQTAVSQIKTVSATENSTESNQWTLVGSFASDGNSTPPVNYSLEANNSNWTWTQTSQGLKLYVSQSLTGSPYNSIKVSPYGIPCLNPSNSPAPSNADDSYPLTGNASTGCGYWGTNEDLYQSLDYINQWNFYWDDDLASNSTFFEDLYGFSNSTVNEYSYIYAERKLVVSDSDFCYSWVQNPSAESNVEDIPNLNYLRSALDTVGFVVVGIAVIAFVIYYIATRGSKSVTKESVGIYVFWFEHGLGCLYAVMALVIGTLTDDLTATIDSDNAYLNEVATAGCVTNVPAINNVYVYLADGITELYAYIEAYNEWNVYVSIVFLVLELILLICWLIIFSCHENLEDEENLNSDTRQLQHMQGYEDVQTVNIINPVPLFVFFVQINAKIYYLLYVVHDLVWSLLHLVPGIILRLEVIELGMLGNGIFLFVYVELSFGAFFLMLVVAFAVYSSGIPFNWVKKVYIGWRFVISVIHLLLCLFLVIFFATFDSTMKQMLAEKNVSSDFTEIVENYLTIALAVSTFFVAYSLLNIFNTYNLIKACRKIQGNLEEDFRKQNKNNKGGWGKVVPE